MSFAHALHCFISFYPLFCASDLAGIVKIAAVISMANPNSAMHQSLKSTGRLDALTLLLDPDMVRELSSR